ncbi:dihydroorotate dehydrogenase electron transfer subunit [Polycladidibacter stylochi]|uniref:dihydroorotate dehydrogenase electron transfer subunit n=1 Tax=Polycladidibacter stylochi TaxID=1807766 RepID=UPI0008314701|nr:dihydroorotate dehydrogenase electron transfer subunit [Pseudovibrio stylochi]
MQKKTLQAALGHPETALTAFEVPTTVLSNKPVNAEYHLLVVSAPEEILACTPGQFFNLLCPVSDAHSPYLRRPMSIYGFDRHKRRLSFLYKVAGEGTGALTALKRGAILPVLGPLGHGYSIKDDWQKLLIVARGVGLATLAPLAQYARQQGRQVTAICSARSQAALLSTDYFRQLGVNVIALTDEDGTSDTQNLRSIIEKQIAENGVDAFYTCGSNRLLAMLQELSRHYGIEGQVALEQQMACGLGMCQCCVRPFNRDGEQVQLRVCREGPVFDLMEAIPC